jgi:cytosine/adenosine deaminase-related metal-dependent hydrolase
VNIACDFIVNPKCSVVENSMISIHDDLFGSLNNHVRSAVVDLTLNNSIAFPGLINIHDHLKYSWHKRIGYGCAISADQKHYGNVYQWLKDLYDEYDKHSNSPDNLNLLIQLGIYKQIFSATTTVVNHSRHSSSFILANEAYINIFDDYQRELVIQPHLLDKITSHNSRFGRGMIEAHKGATVLQQPFMIHAAEGRDIATQMEISILDDSGMLTPETILVHCINTSSRDIDLIRKGGCSVVWCPYSSKYVIGCSANIHEFIKNGINVCIGTDSSCSGSINLLHELRFARQRYLIDYESTLSDNELFDMVTVNPAKALRIEQKYGSISEGYCADLVIIDNKTKNPYTDIINSNFESIIALISNGKAVYGDEDVVNKLPKHKDCIYSCFSINGRKKSVIGNPFKLVMLAKKAFRLKNEINFPFVPAIYD